MLLLARADLDPWLIFFALMSFFVSLWAAHSVDPEREIAQPPLHGLARFAAILAAAAALAAGLTGTGLEVLAPLAAFIALASAIRLFARRLSLPGVAWLTVQFGGFVVAWGWACLFLLEMRLSAPAETFAVAGMTLSLGIALLGCTERIAREAILTHEHWQLPVRAPQRAHAAAAARREPRVSIHLPCYAEPPAVVMETMNRLALLDYRNFEVLVCDNNTADETLWRPLEAHCRALNDRLAERRGERLGAGSAEQRFRFFHVAPLPGAKAGALNFCLEQMDPATEIVAVIDADYFSRPDFLVRLVPFFDDPRVGYIQTPHDYRDFQGNPYLTGSYWEYMPNNKVDMPGVSEYGGAFTIGTMCLLRADVLRTVGGWAEWCLTEDSEVSVRLREAGYRGIYLRETFGRGLIPDSFGDYKKQRFRWTAGPVQQLRRHWRLFLPAPFAKPMPGWTKLLEVLRCIAPLQTLAALLFGLAMLGWIAAETYLQHMAPVRLPPTAWMLAGLGSATWMVRTWHRYSLTGSRRIGDMLLGEIARASLTYVVLVGGIAGLSRKPLAWRRTPKFGSLGHMRKALGSALPECALGLICFALALAVVRLPRLGHDFALISAASLAALGLRFWAAPAMALLAAMQAGKAASDPPQIGLSGGTAGGLAA